MQGGVPCGYLRTLAELTWLLASSARSSSVGDAAKPLVTIRGEQQSHGLAAYSGRTVDCDLTCGRGGVPNQTQACR